MSLGRAIASQGPTASCRRSATQWTSNEATYTNTIGAPLLASYWTDPEFNASERAFYYVRVLEIPTPRWTVYDAKFFGTKPPPEAPTSIQDRAYTSPIWYTP